MNPEILDNVKAEAAEVRSKRHTIDAPLRTSPKLMEFVEEAFNQTFHEAIGVGVSGFTQADKEEVLLLSKEPPDKEAEAVEDLLRLYVDVCNMWPDVLNQAYGGTTADFAEFRTELIPHLLQSLGALAKARSDEDLQGEIGEIWEDYASAIADARETIGT